MSSFKSQFTLCISVGGKGRKMQTNDIIVKTIKAKAIVNTTFKLTQAILE